MHAMTAGNLRSAYAGESMAHMRYKVWADKAEKDGFPNVARLFRAISVAEQVHATNHFRALRDEAGDYLVPGGAGFGLGPTADNLQGAIEGENFEVGEMYAVYREDAKVQGEAEAEQSFMYAQEAEKIHAVMYADAKKSVEAGRDIDLGPVQVCPVCGHTVEGEAPDKCPICGAKKKVFMTFA
jgi:rubrerythrin